MNKISIVFSILFLALLTSCNKPEQTAVEQKIVKSKDYRCDLVKSLEADRLDYKKKSALGSVTQTDALNDLKAATTIINLQGDLRNEKVSCE